MLIKFSREFCRAVPLAVAVASVSQLVSAEDLETGSPDEARRIEMVVVTGYATGGLDAEITAEDIRERAAADMADMFRANPVISAGGAVGVGQKIVVRNIGEDALNISIDGTDQTNGVFHHAGRISLDPELLKRVEIEVGAGSATAGPGALGGSLHFTTKDPSDLIDGDQKIGALVRGSYFSNGSGHKASATVYGAPTDFVSGMVSFGRSDMGEVEDGDGNTILGSGSEQTLAYGKLVFDFSENQFLSLSHESITEDGAMPYKTEWVIGEGRNETAYSETEVTRQTSTLNYAYQPQDNNLINVKLTVYNTETDQIRDYRVFDALGNGNGSTESSGLNFQNASEIGNHELIYGLNYRDDKSIFSDDYQEFDQDLNDYVLDPSFSEETGGVTGVYLQDIFEVNSDWTISGGMRYDEYSFTSRNGQGDGTLFQFSRDGSGEAFEADDGGTSFNLSTNYYITPEFSVSAGYAEALRGIEAADPYKAVSVSGYEQNIQAEEADNIEFAFEYESGGFTSGVGVFRSNIENGIVAASPVFDDDGINVVEPLGGPDSVAPWGRAYVNLDEKIETEGFFIDLGYRAAVAGFSVNFLSADTTVAGEKATRYLWAGKINSIGDTLVLDAYWNVTESLKLVWALESVQGIDDIEQTKYLGGESLELRKPSYVVHDMYVNWKPLGDSLNLDLAFKNIFNEQYISHAAVANHSDNPGWEGLRGQSDQGRDIRLSIGYTF